MGMPLSVKKPNNTTVSMATVIMRGFFSDARMSRFHETSLSCRVPLMGPKDS